MTWLAGAEWTGDEADAEDAKPPPATPEKSTKGGSAEKTAGITLPSVLKFESHQSCRVLVAEADRVIAAGASSANPWVWTATAGVVQLKRPWLPVPEGHEDYFAGPVANGIALLPEGRFLLASRRTGGGDSFTDGQLAIFTMDGTLVCARPVAPGCELGGVAASRDGKLLAVGVHESREKDSLQLWRTDDFLAGGKPLHVVDALPFGPPLAFTASGAALVGAQQTTLWVLSTAKAKAQRFDLGEHGGGYTQSLTLSDADEACVSDGQGGALVSLRGQCIVQLPRVSGLDKVRDVTGTVIVSPRGRLVAAAGSADKAWQKRTAAVLSFTHAEMRNGYVAAFSRECEVEAWSPLTKKDAVGALALVDGLATIVGQTSATFHPWLFG